MTTPKTRWGRWFRKTRKRLGMSQIEMSKKLRVSQSWVSKVESGDITNPGIEECFRLRRIARKARVQG